jgi:hypothetical protein
MSCVCSWKAGEYTTLHQGSCYEFPSDLTTSNDKNSSDLQVANAIKSRLVLVTWMEQTVSGYGEVVMNTLDSGGQPTGGGSLAIELTVDQQPNTTVNKPRSKCYDTLEVFGATEQNKM